jgi:hypothetical protein
VTDDKQHVTRFQREFPRTMLRVMMRKSAVLHSAETHQGFAARAVEIQKKNGSRNAVDYLLRELGFDLTLDRDEQYFAEALSFHLGLLEAFSGRPEAMSEHIQRSRTMPGPEDEHLFSDHVAISIVTREHQLAAISRGLPAILFACMPRSASATLTHSLAKLLDVPVLHTSLGVFPDYFIAPSWLDMFLEGGALTQDHFMLNEFNFGVLKSRGRRNVFVSIRDPRAAARSHVHWLSRWGNADSMTLEERIERECIGKFIPWLQCWIDRARDSTSPLHIQLIKFQDIVRDLPGTLRRIVRTLQDEYPVLASYAEHPNIEEVRVHFKEGDDEAWRSEVSETTSKKLWEACSPEIRELLNLVP